MSPRKTEFTERINVFFSQEQLSRIKDDADKLGLTVSAYVRFMIVAGKKETCKMIEDRTEIYCSECGVRMNDEIYFMFKGLKDGFKFCPCCGRKIEKK